MRVIVRSEGTNLWLPLPPSLVGNAILLLPEFVFEKIRQALPDDLQDLVTKELICALLRECLSDLREFKGLEIVHVEGQDGTFVSIRI